MLVDQFALAQEPQSRFLRNGTIGGDLHFQSWRGDGDLSIRQISIPIHFVFPVNNRLSIDMTTGSGFASLDRGTSRSLGGLTDTKIRASYLLGDEIALLTAGVNTPTGRTELDEEQQEVSSFLSQNALDFRTANFGQGLDLNLGIATARKVGDMVLGLGAGFLAKGQFTPRDGGPQYQPGNEVSLTAGLDYRILAGDGRLTLDAVYTIYGEDQQGGARIYQSGDKILVQALGLLRTEWADWRVHLIERSKGKNTSFAATSPLDFSNGNQFEAGISILKAQSRDLGWRGLVDLKIYGDNEFKRGEALILGVGPGLRFKFGGQHTFDFSVKYARAKVDDVNLNGIDVNGGVWFRL